MIKQNWGFTCFLMGVIALIPLLGYAKPPLGLKELTQLGIQNNKDLKAARFAIAIAEARLVQSGLWSNPSLNLNNNKSIDINLNQMEKTNHDALSEKSNRSVCMSTNKRRKTDMTCIICHDYASGYNFNQISCNSCKGN